MTRETTDNDTAEQVIESFRVLAGDKVILNTAYFSASYRVFSLTFLKKNSNVNFLQTRLITVSRE
jgi:hypothetical protein